MWIIGVCVCIFAQCIVAAYYVTVLTYKQGKFKGSLLTESVSTLKQGWQLNIVNICATIVTGHQSHGEKLLGYYWLNNVHCKPNCLYVGPCLHCGTRKCDLSHWEHVEGALLEAVYVVWCVCHLKLTRISCFRYISWTFSDRAHMSFPYLVHFVF